ncbi:MAG: ABC transporter permease [Bryobacteraceae bacterium]|jgi:putative ABC transport system permease protein
MYAFELFWDLARQTLANLRRNKLRSFLTLFGIGWGIASLVMMSALSDGFRDGQRKNMAQIGDNLVFLWGGRTELQAGGKRAGRWIQLKRDDVDLIRQQCPAVGIVASESKSGQVPAHSATNAGRFLTLGVTPEYLKLRNLPVENGRTISQADVREQRRVAVLGSAVRKQLFEKKPVPLGETIYLRNYPYEVVGLMSEKDQNSSYDGWDNDKILVPEPALLRDMPERREFYSEGLVNCIIYRPASTKNWAEAEAEVKTALGKVKEFDPKDESAMETWDMIKESEMFDSIFDAGEIFLAVVSLVTLSLGGIGVMNTMMMAVRERTNEIGLKKAVGATKGRITLEFFLEGLFLALLAGVVGMGLVVLLSKGVNALPMPQMFSGLPIHWNVLGLATLALGLVAVCSSLPPARRAADLTPVEALRFER